MEPAKIGFINLSGHEQLQSDTNKSNKMVNRLLSEETDAIGELLLCDTTVSGRSIFQNSFPALRNLQVVDFSRTKTTITALLSLSTYNELIEARFDACPELKLVYANLHSLEPQPKSKLKKLSLVGTYAVPEAIRKLIDIFPCLEQLDYTLRLADQKALGLKNSCQFQIVDNFTLRLKRVDNVWKAILLDGNKEPLKEGQKLRMRSGEAVFKVTDNVQLDTTVNLDEDFIRLLTRHPTELLDRQMQEQSVLEKK